MSESGLLVLGADVGGTHTKLALARMANDRAEMIERRIYPSSGFPALDAVIATFLAQDTIAPHAGAIHAGCFAVAGPVEAGRGRLTNLPWDVDEAAIAERFGFPARVINDFAAAGLGIAQLSPGDLLALQRGSPVERGQRVVVGAGTGLGVAVLDWDGTHYEVHASEAGHCDFAPVDPLQDRLLVHLRRQYPRVSYERVLSGGGLVRILQFLEETGAGSASDELHAALAHEDAGQAISALALAKKDALAVQALDLFVSLYGAFAGNMALATLARGGVYIAGGIAPAIAEKLRDGAFIRAFTAKGRFRAFLETLPVHVVMNDQVGLYGALAEAARLV